MTYKNHSYVTYLLVCKSRLVAFLLLRRDCLFIQPCWVFLWLCRSKPPKWVFTVAFQKAKIQPKTVEGRANLHTWTPPFIFFIVGFPDSTCACKTANLRKQRKEFVERRDAILEKYKAHTNIIRRVKDLIRSVNCDERSQTCRSRSFRREIILMNLQFLFLKLWLFDSIDFEGWTAHWEMEMQQVSKQVMLVPRTGMCWNYKNENSKAGSFWRHVFKRFAFTENTFMVFLLSVFNGSVVESSLRHQFLWHVSSKPQTFFLLEIGTLQKWYLKEVLFKTTCGCFLGRWSLEYPFWGESHNTNVW